MIATKKIRIPIRKEARCTASVTVAPRDGLPPRRAGILPGSRRRPHHQPSAIAVRPAVRTASPFPPRPTPRPSSSGDSAGMQREAADE